MEELLLPLHGYSKIHIEENFTQSEIVAIHASYGVFLTPSRTDTQRVSRDETMSSGLVPVTNAVSAIPVFVNEEYTILPDKKDYLDLADGIKKLHLDPNLYVKMSENAGKKHRRFRETIPRAGDFSVR